MEARDARGACKMAAATVFVRAKQRGNTLLARASGRKHTHSGGRAWRASHNIWLMVENVCATDEPQIARGLGRTLNNLPLAVQVHGNLLARHHKALLYQPAGTELSKPFTSRDKYEDTKGIAWGRRNTILRHETHYRLGPRKGEGYIHMQTDQTGHHPPFLSTPTPSQRKLVAKEPARRGARMALKTFVTNSCDIR